MSSISENQFANSNRGSLIRRLDTFLFDTRSNRERRRRDPLNTAASGAVVVKSAVRLVSGDTPNSERNPLHRPSFTPATRVEVGTQADFERELAAMHRELEAPFTRINRGSELMKNKFDEAIDRALQEDEFIQQAIAEASNPDGISVEQLIREAGALDLNPKDVLQRVLFDKEDEPAEILG